MEGSGEKVRMGFLEREIRTVQTKLDKLLDRDASFERRIQRLEDLKIEHNFSSISAKIQQLQNDANNRKTRDDTKAWFWGKIAAFVTFIASIVASVWFYVRG